MKEQTGSSFLDWLVAAVLILIITSVALPALLDPQANLPIHHATAKILAQWLS